MNRLRRATLSHPMGEGLGVRVSSTAVHGEGRDTFQKQNPHQRNQKMKRE
jgi:hypothetical protein